MACGQGTNGGRSTYQSGGRLNSPRQSDNTAMVFKCIISYALFCAHLHLEGKVLGDRTLSMKWLLYFV